MYRCLSAALGQCSNVGLLLKLFQVLFYVMCPCHSQQMLQHRHDCHNGCKSCSMSGEDVHILQVSHP
jgi:hypothetical protein